MAIVQTLTKKGEMLEVESNESVVQLWKWITEAKAMRRDFIMFVSPDGTLNIMQLRFIYRIYGQDGQQGAIEEGNESSF